MIELNKKTLKRIFFGVAACIILYWLLHETERVQQVIGRFQKVLSPFVIGAGLAFVLNVPMRAFEGWFKGINNISLRRVIAVALTFLVLMLVLALVFWLLIPQLIETVQSLTPQVYRFFMDMEGFLKETLKSNPELFKWIVDNTNLENLNWTELVQKFLSLFGDSVTKILETALSAIGSVTGTVFNLVIAIVFAIYCLFQKETLARQGRRLAYAFLKEKTADYIIRVLRLSNSTFSNFLSGQCIEVCILGCMFAVVMAIFKMPYIPLISVLIAVTAFIPIVGAWVGCIVGAFLILVVNPIQAVWFVVMFLIIQQIEGNLIYPKVVGTSIGLNGMWVLLAISVGGELMGVAGMFLMIPFASVIYTLLREYTHKRLDGLTVDPDKLNEQPPELKNNLKELRKNNKIKREKNRAERKSLKEEKIDQETK